MFMYILRPFMDEVLSEEIVKKDNWMGGNFPGGGAGIFQGEVWWVGIFPGGGNFLRTLKNTK